ncbi:PAS domain S-box protein [Ammoniphilus sp. CFH 90114]|nr:PAS domain S-box protein [Ammoniphilus sp. CFH 90114]
MPDPIYIIDLDDRFIWGNREYEKRFGFTDEPLFHKQISDRDGASVNADVNLIPILDEENRPMAYTVLLRVEAIITENTSDTIVLVDNDFMVRYVSPSFHALSGYHSEDYVGTDSIASLHPEDSERVRRLHLEALQSKRSIDLDYRFTHSKGHTVHVESRVKPVLDGSGNVKYFVAVVRDVTDRKKTEQLLKNILDNVDALVFSTDKHFTSYSFLSESVEKVMGIPRQEAIHHPMRLHDHIHPDDNEVMMGELKTQLDQGLPISHSFRMIHMEGEIRWAKMFVHPWLDHTGEVERLDGIVLDITEKMRSELALEESEQRYKSLFENNLDGVFSIELSGFYFVNANPAFELITGIDSTHLKDRCFLGIIYDEDQSQVYEALFEVIAQGKPRDIECRLNPTQAGEKMVSITFVPIFLVGKLNGIHGIIKDITKRKREEKELILSEERYKFLQQRLNRFSNDLTDVMKVSELENRLIDEVRAVLQVTDVSIVEVPKGKESMTLNPHETWIVIGEKEHPVYLRITMNQSLLRIEEEWLDTAVHYVTILYDNLHLIEDLMKRLEQFVTTKETPKWMLRLLFNLSEKERSSLSSDLHDSVLQDLIIWYRKLESLRSTTIFEEKIERELTQIEEGLLDAIHQIRITCNELRPPFLLKMGLVESLKSLFEYTRMFANYEIEFTAQELQVTLNEEQIIGLYRIVQELLNNASKHSRASKITLSLSSQANHVQFSYSDDGVGMNLSGLEGSFDHMGISGIEKRVLSLEGHVDFRSAPQQGFHVTIQVPKL